MMTSAHDSRTGPPRTRGRTVLFAAIVGLVGSLTMFATTGTAAAYAARTTATIHLRAGPGVRYRILATIPRYSSVDVLSCLRSGWCRTAWDGFEGYASRRYLAGGVTYYEPETEYGPDYYYNYYPYWWQYPPYWLGGYFYYYDGSHYLRVRRSHSWWLQNRTRFDRDRRKFAPQGAPRPNVVRPNTFTPTAPAPRIQTQPQRLAPRNVPPSGFQPRSSGAPRVAPGSSFHPPVTGGAPRVAPGSSFHPPASGAAPRAPSGGFGGRAPSSGRGRRDQFQ